MNNFEIGLLYKNETGNIIPRIEETFTWEDDKDNLLYLVKDLEEMLPQINTTLIKDLPELIGDLNLKLEELQTSIKDLNTDIECSLSNDSKDYIKWLETKIK